MKSDFLKYIGAEDNLAGYSRSYKLVLYKAFFSLMDSSGNASGYKVAEFFRNFYVDRVHRGLKADLNVDSRIENIEQSSVQDVYDIILLNPFKHISDRGYLSRKKDSNGKEQFALNQDLLKELTKEDIDGILSVVERKLNLYFSKIDGGENMALHDLVYRWMNEYANVLSSVKEKNDFKNPFREIIAKEIPALLSELAPISAPYIVTGSYGKGRWTDVPWIAVFDSRITTSAQKGVYIVYLLNKDTKTLYLTLNQGATDAAQSGTDREEQKPLVFTGIARSQNEKMTERLQKSAENIREIIGDTAQTYGSIDSGSPGYDAGCVYYKKYDLSDLPDDSKLISDLRDFLALYADYYNKISGTEWWPSPEEYTPGITKAQWVDLLNTPEIFNSARLEMMAQFYALGGQASCIQLAEAYGKTSDYYRMACGVHLAERIHKETKCPLCNQENAKFWPVLFVGRNAKNRERGNYIWKLRDELKAALEEINIMQYLGTSGGEEELSVKDIIAQIKEYIAAKGFSYEDGLIENFYLSLKSKPFVILAGTSGTGKTRLVKLFAEAVGATTANGRYKMVSVRPDWSDSSDLFGHVDLNGKFIPGAIIDFVKKAEIDNNYPYFLCLDEMNLARVEYYLSDILSVIETRDFVGGAIQSDPLISDTYYGSDTSAAGRYGTVRLPENLYIIGTVNMDETTFPFSRKVLDRANTIEFSYVDLMPAFDALPDETPQALNLSNAFLKTEYLLLNQCAVESETVTGYCVELQKVNRVLQKANAHVGYRVRDEIVFYLLNSKKHDLLSEDQAMDNEVMQKILPRIQGSSASVKTMLCELFKFCAGDYDGYQAQSDNISDKMRKALNDTDRKIKYRRSAEKIELMTRRFEEDGFTSYWL